MRTTIYFVRHAESQSNANPLFEGGDDTLTDMGLKQAESVARYFKKSAIDAVYMSNILRSQLTALEIEKVIGIKATEIDFIRERKGAFSSEKQYSHVEDFEDLKVRLSQAKHFFEQLGHKHVVVVSHAIFLKSLAAFIMLGGAFNEEALGSIESSLVLDNGGVSKLVFNSEKKAWRIMSWNDKGHEAHVH